MVSEAHPSPRILIACEHASARFGGEAALPLHYFRVLNARGHAVWLVTHARTRDELTQLYGAHERIHYIEDSTFHRAMWQVSKCLPDRLAYFSTGFLSRLASQFSQRRLVRQLVKSERIDVVHQPMPVSPKEPSVMFDVGAPVVIGPMNGGMNYPAAFTKYQSAAGTWLLGLGRRASSLANRLMPGKRRSAVLLVANERTRLALPDAPESEVIELVENGVDLQVWQAQGGSTEPEGAGPTRFLFMGRLVDWKAVDLLLEAFQRAAALSPMTLTIAGDGVERARLQQQCEAAGLLARQPGEPGKVFFAGWQTQQQCAVLLREASALVLSSLMECGGAVVLEAMAARRPVIATDWGGPADYLDPSCGILVPPSSREGFIEGFAQALRTLSESHALRVRMGAAGHAKVVRIYDWNVKVDTMLGIYARAGAPVKAKVPEPRR
jgi:glycosyltransferase involved in cell wall biosynthesis